MGKKYSILRDLGGVRMSSPFELTRPTITTPVGSVSEPHVEVVELTKREIRELARDPEVRGIAPVMPTKLIRPLEIDGNNRRAAENPSSNGSTGVTWGVKAVGADVSRCSGANVIVSVLDTGIDSSHPAFGGMNLVQEDFSGSGIGDKFGHGTHCAGTIFGRPVDGTRIGVAPGVTKALIGKVLDDNGFGDTEMLLRGLEWALHEGAQVISMSIGWDFPGYVQFLVEQMGLRPDVATSMALEAYRANVRLFDVLMQLIARREAIGPGTIVTAAAGNESSRPEFEIAVTIPAAAEGVVSVGALEQSHNGLFPAWFSNTFPQISAPGVNIESAQLGGGLVSWSGTSMATPHVAGVLALWWEEVMKSPVPVKAATVLARMLAHASIEPFVLNVDIADRGIGIVRAP
ncbi:S8 family serine peptidase [Nonomuraea sp. GTA35]|uniref:S8 family peptidase n=1 Tax=Nonomuraea sp. GTA35 TaxID=1676746 RepID=UPI0035C1C456